MSRDLILYLILGSVGLFGAAAMFAAPAAFSHEWHRDDPIHWRLRVRFLMALAAIVDNATWPARGAR